MNEPCGVIGALCPDEAPLLGLISVMAPAIAMGNTVVLVPGQHPLSATDFYQVLDTSDLPAGVVNIVTGPPQDLAKSLAGHMDVDAVWSFSSHPLSALIDAKPPATSNAPGSTNGRARNWMGAEGEGRVPVPGHRGQDRLGAVWGVTVQPS
jgi:aldehyde dehydrogenase (NAD+)